MTVSSNRNREKRWPRRALWEADRACLGAQLERRLGSLHSRCAWLGPLGSQSGKHSLNSYSSPHTVLGTMGDPGHTKSHNRWASPPGMGISSET